MALVEELRLQALSRSTCGKGAARRLRREGWVPGSLYGAVPSTPVQVRRKDLEQLMRQEGYETRLVTLQVGGNGAPADGAERHHVLIKEVQTHPVRDTLLHVDLYAVRMDRPVRARVPVAVEGLEALERRDLVPAFGLRELEVECLPTRIPSHFVVDASGLEAGDNLTVASLTPPEGVRILSDPDEVLVSALVPRAAREEEAAPAAGEGAEGAASGEAGGPAEPERVQRPREKREAAEGE